ncbi:MAG: hypothetical protein IJE07_04930 [Clostridia bacterium]|nr:hypothetical protein [Clostridia bacterium]
MMKKLLAMLLLLFVLPCAALAELDGDGNVVVTLEDAQLFFTPPEGAYMLTLESSASEFNALGLSQREIIPWMEEYDLVVIFFDEAFGWEMHVQAYPCEYDDFDDLTTYALALEVSYLSSLYQEQGYEMLSIDGYLAPEGHQFICAQTLYTYEDGTPEPQVEYYTIQGNCVVSIYLMGYAEQLTDEQLAIAQAVADSLRIEPIQ